MIVITHHSSTSPFAPTIEIIPSLRGEGGLVKWDESGFTVSASSSTLKGKPSGHSSRKQFGLRNLSTIDTSFSSSDDNASVAGAASRPSGFDIKVIYSDNISIENPLDVWLGQFQAESKVSSSDSRREIPLQSLLDSDDDNDDFEENDRYHCPEPPHQLDRYDVAYAHKTFPSEDWSGLPPPERTSPVSPMGSYTGSAIAESVKAAYDIERDRQRIRKAIVQSMSISTAETTSADETPREVANFWDFTGWTCCGPTTKPSPVATSDKMISCTNSTSLSTLSR